jgi:CO/xanthine dehydrogenase Mo-binding subunit
LWYGEALGHHLVARDGDFLCIPGDMPHLPYNLSDIESCVAVIARTDPDDQVFLQFVSETYMAQVAEVEVAKDGAVRVRRVVCALDCGTVVNADTVRAQVQSAIIIAGTRLNRH